MDESNQKLDQGDLEPNPDVARRISENISWHSVILSMEEIDDSEDENEEKSFASTAQDVSSNASLGTRHYRGLAEDETKVVKRLRLAMILLLIAISVSISVIVYKFLHRTEVAEFEDEFEAQGNKLIAGFRNDAFQKMQALDSLSRAFTNQAQAAGMAWPFVVVPNSHEFFLPYLSLVNAASIRLLPVVGARQRLEWEEFAVETKGWVEEDLLSRLGEEALQSNETSRLLQYFGESDSDNKVSDYIKNYVGLDTSPNMWLPWWQYAPVLENRWFINFNQLANSQFFRVSESALSGKAVISATETFTPGLDFQSTKDFTFTQELLEVGGYGEYEAGEPIGSIHYPVFRETIGKGPTAAILTATVYWRTYFQNILSEKTSGIICVVENDIQSFTYRINGKQAVFMGMEDLHDKGFDNLGIVADYKSFEESPDSTSRYTGVEVDDQNQAGGYRIRVYPDQELYDLYVTNEPYWYALLVMAIMLLAIFTFIVYDCYVERRQNMVENVAENSNAIVSSLFPKTVKDKLMQAEENKQQSAKGKSAKNPLRTVDNTFVAKAMRKEDIRKHPMTDDDADSLGVGDTPPIADLFPSATVLFMDIAGFTSWSSQREPSQVFVLLETLYRNFDKIAKSRGVFKVETIGDCYVAVCGLPEPCEDHAVQMSKFARDCLEKMSSLVVRLESKLGADTGDLSVRVGMHSGPVTAGVLRGERARFQLFGDTVNTAARMESLGKPSRIHISEATAKLLAKSGKKAWIVKRETTVEAKGKGELQTYWLVPKRAGTATASSIGEEFTVKSVTVTGSLEGDSMLAHEESSESSEPLKA